MEQYQSHTDPK